MVGFLFDGVVLVEVWFGCLFPGIFKAATEAVGLGWSL